MKILSALMIIILLDFHMKSAGARGLNTHNDCRGSFKTSMPQADLEGEGALTGAEVFEIPVTT